MLSFCKSNPGQQILNEMENIIATALLPWCTHTQPQDQCVVPVWVCKPACGGWRSVLGVFLYHAPSHLIFAITIFIIFMCVQMYASLWRSENDLWELVLSSHHVAHMVRLFGKCLLSYP